MIDNVYELKQRFVGFDKVKLLTVVFYCMAYSWCSFLNEYNASDINKGKDKWAVEDDAVVYKGDGFTVTYTWNEKFWEGLDTLRNNNYRLNENPFPAGYWSAIRLVEFLYRFQNALGIDVDEEVKYIAVAQQDLPGCCQSCCKGKFEGETLYRIWETNELEDRILTIKLAQGTRSSDARKRWYGSAGVISIDGSDPSKLKKKNVLAIIANLFKPEAVGEFVEKKLVLSESVTGLINEKKPGYVNVSFGDVWSLEGVIKVERKDNVNI
ncbi:MAG: hypothetical protein II393_04760 [Cytophagales bacterium]|nr:hypothetical protein [Cytophagales bacterium]